MITEQQNVKHKRPKRRVFFSLSGILLLVFTCILVFIYTSQINVFWKSTVEQITLNTEKYEKIIYMWFLPKLEITGMICNDLTFFALTENKEIEQYLSKIMAANPVVIAAYLATEDKKIVAGNGRLIPAGFDPTERDWYLYAQKKPGRAVVSEPYIDIITGGMVITVAQALQLNNGLKGAIGIDIYFSEISDYVRSVHPYLNGMSFLLSHEGNIITHANEDFLPRNKDNSVVYVKYSDIPVEDIRMIKTSSNNVTLERLVMNGVPKYVSKTVIGDINWYYGTEIPISDFNKSRLSIAYPLVITLLIGLGVFIAGIILYILHIITLLRSAEEIKRRKSLTDILNRMAALFLSQSEDTFENIMTEGVKLFVDMIGIDRMSVFQNSYMQEGLRATQVYRWDRNSGGTTKPNPVFYDFAYSQYFPEWESMFLNGQSVNGPVNLLPQREMAVLNAVSGVISVYITPVFLRKEFWGFVLYEDHKTERCFDADFMDIMSSAAILCVNTIIRHKMERDIAEQMRMIELVGLIDPLTNIPNRRHFDNKMKDEWSRAFRNKLTFSLCILDIDHFKKFNDNYGHLHGDEVLKLVAQIIKNSLKRSTDFAARWGGEEFAVLLPNTDIDGALRIAEDIRCNIESAVIPNTDEAGQKITISIGVANATPVSGGLITDLIERSDKALYEAKNTGRNRVCFCL
jgi:diguanylate cyclase (GGDEF)-like protein